MFCPTCGSASRNNKCARCGPPTRRGFLGGMLALLALPFLGRVAAAEPTPERYVVDYNFEYTPPAGKWMHTYHYGVPDDVLVSDGRTWRPVDQGDISNEVTIATVGDSHPARSTPDTPRGLKLRSITSRRLI